MHSPDHIARLRKKVHYTNGLRNLAAKAELVEALTYQKSVKEATDLAADAVDQARRLLAKARERGSTDRAYREALARCLHAHGASLKQNHQLPQAEGVLLEALTLYEDLAKWPEFLECVQLLSAAYNQQNKHDLAIEYLDLGIACGENSNLREALPLLYKSKGDTLLIVKDLSGAKTCFERAVELAPEADSRRATALASLGYYYYSTGDTHTADLKLREAISILRQIEHHSELVHTLRLASLNCNLAGNVSEAFSLNNEAIAVVKQLDNTWQEADLRYAAGELHKSYDRYDLALEQFNMSFKLFEKAGDKEGMATCLASLGFIAKESGDRDAQLDYFRRCALLLPQCGTSVKVVFAIANLVRHCPECCDLDELREYINKILRVGSFQYSLNSRILLYNALGDLHFAGGDFDAAKTSVRQALALASEHGSRKTQAECFLNLGTFHHQRGDFAKAIDLLNEGIKKLQNSPQLKLLRSIHGLLADVHESAGNHAKALEHLRAMLQFERDVEKKRQRLRLEQLIPEHDAHILRQDNAAMQVQLDLLTKEYQSVSSALQVTGSQLERDEHIFRELRQLLRGKETDHAALLELQQKARHLVAERLNEFESSGPETVLIPLDQGILARLADEYPQLTTTERKVCALIGSNVANKDIARLLNVTPRSVESYRYRIRKKFDLEAGTDLNGVIARLARRP